MMDVFSEVRYFHGHLGILPPLIRYYNFFARLLNKAEKKNISDDTVKDSDIPPFGLFRALTYIFYYSIDYFLGHITVSFAKGHGQLVIFDRYFYDYLIQHRYNKIPRWLLTRIPWFLPKPDVLIWLENKPEIIHERKPELNISQIMAQCDVCRELVKKHHNAVSILTDDDPDVTFQNVRKVILRAMTQRVAKRMK